MSRGASIIGLLVVGGLAFASVSWPLMFAFLVPAAVLAIGSSVRRFLIDLEHDTNEYALDGNPVERSETPLRLRNDRRIAARPAEDDAPVAVIVNRR